jgi:hypothetical protein
VTGAKVQRLGDYLVRVMVGPLRLHVFLRGDADPDCHDHPADFWTFPLVPYVEVMPDGTSRVVKAFRLHFRRAEFAHRVLGDSEDHRPVVTIVWWGRKRREWGFVTPNGWVPWQEYVKGQT